MLKLIASVFFIGLSVLGFSAQDDEEMSPEELFSMISKMPAEELSEELELARSSDSLYTYGYVGFALRNIEEGKYSLAIENLSKAEASYFTSTATLPEIEFLIAFARVVAYDNLDMARECIHSLGSMILAASEDDEPEVLNSEPGALQQLASRAKSSNVRKCLLAMSDD